MKRKKKKVRYDKESTSKCSSESSSSGEPTAESEGTAPGDNPEMEINPNEDVVAPSNENVDAMSVVAGVIVSKESSEIEGALVVNSAACAIFNPPFVAPLADHVLIGGFGVPAKYAELYTRIWDKHGHIAMTKKISSRVSLVKRVEEALSSIHDMCSVTGHTVSGEVISNWEYHRDMCVNFEFNASWFCEGFSKIKKLHTEVNEVPSLDLINQQEVEIEKLSQELKLKQVALQNMKDAFSKKNELLLDDFP
ncbi:uncharacterized protein LOC113300091 [Papaver somniferum]|uniref:uncharacterized protein LOC113300091 n=1 Tax=Papaver somniferum TaxID=3469 RepID=UPI000E6F691E|nr:uncharacterized protein LOC113300091 [Papaver somniferum]